MNSNDQIQKTIVVEDGVMIVVDGKAAKARLVWRAAGLDIFVQGALSGLDFETAGNIACNLALGMNIPLISLRYQRDRASKKHDALSKRMFS